MLQVMRVTPGYVTLVTDMKAENGRPRDTRIDTAVLAAAAELLGEVGYADLTVAAIADRAGTSRPAVYRRWPSKAHLVHEAAFRDAVIAPRVSTGELATDVHQLVRGTADLLTTPLARLVVPGLVAEAADDPALHARLLERFSSQGWGGVEAFLGAAAEAGEVRRDVDAGTVMEIVIGTALVAVLVRGSDGLTDDWVERTTAFVLRGLRP